MNCENIVKTIMKAAKLIIYDNIVNSNQPIGRKTHEPEDHNHQSACSWSSLHW